jgi:NTP pyrophosphatase (non-canonical NTP hydrolase)
MKQEEKLLKIINHYGVNNQQRKLQEEVFELNEAIISAEHSRCVGITRDVAPIGIEHIAEEIADVMVMIEQFKLYYGITSEEITNIFWSKVDRQLERIERENEK